MAVSLSGPRISFHTFSERLDCAFPSERSSSCGPRTSCTALLKSIAACPDYLRNRALSRANLFCEEEKPWFGKRVDARRTIQQKNQRTCLNVSAAILDDVPHLSNWLHDLPEYRNPLQSNPAYSCVEQYFVHEKDFVVKDIVVRAGEENPNAIHFRRAGPRDYIVFEPDEVKAAVVTCGGLCPGLNTVIREIVCSLWEQYGVRDIVGIDSGYRGFYARNVITLTPRVVNDIHKRGGTILHTSRGGHDTGKIVDAIMDRGINQVYIIGGDGTQRGADLIHKEVMRRGLKVAIAGIPKTIDNDIAVIDKSFGFDSAVEEAQRAINAAHVEAESVENGIGLVKLMGRYSGYIAMHATLASRDVDCCLIPEVPFYLEGPGGLFEYIQRRLRENGHMILVVAEGAGQELIAEAMDASSSKLDASGNRLLLDVGLWLSERIRNHFIPKGGVNLKYIDPTYMVRAIPSNASDNVYCTLLAHSAIHGAMAGYTGFTVGPVNGRHAYIPIARVTQAQNKVNVSDRMWARLLSSTQQPSFIPQDEIERRRDLNDRTKADLHAPGPTTAHLIEAELAQQDPKPVLPPTPSGGNGSLTGGSTAPPVKAAEAAGKEK